MRKNYTLLVLLLFCGWLNIASAQNVGINDDASQPDNSAMLDIKSASKGMLIPRVALTSTMVEAPVTSPAVSLLVYNTVTTGDVTPGFYFWNGFFWSRLTTAGASQLNVVNKSDDGDIDRSENMVMASGDITLTLPALTDADSGLEISVKNVGTYTDLVIVQGNGGATIDGRANATLTLWHGDTYVARGGNWVIREKETRPDNIYDVCPNGSWTSIAEIVDFLDQHMSGPAVVRFGGGDYTVTSPVTIDLPYPVTFEGTSYGETNIIAESGIGASPMFTCATECYFKMLAFDGTSATNEGIRLSGVNKYYEIKDCSFEGFTKTVAMTGNDELWVFDTDFDGATTAGIEISASGATTLKVSETDFMSCAKGINLLGSNGGTASIINCTFYNSTGNTGILYTPASYLNFASIFITNNAWNNIGTFISGFDFTLISKRDANAYVENNAGMEDENPHCKINVVNNTQTTTCTTQNVYYKAQFTNTTSYKCKWTVDNNKVTYQPANHRDVVMNVTGNISCDNSNRNITIAIVKNGVATTQYGPITIRNTTANGYFPFSTVVYLQDVAPNDYFEIYISSANNGDVVTLSDINWFTDAR